MSEHDPTIPETHDTLPINRLDVIRRLREAGIESEYDEDMGVDDNDLLGNLITIGLENGLEPEDIFGIAGIPVDKLGGDE